MRISNRTSPCKDHFCVVVCRAEALTQVGHVSGNSLPQFSHQTINMLSFNPVNELIPSRDTEPHNNPKSRHDIMFLWQNFNEIVRDYNGLWYVGHTILNIQTEHHLPCIYIKYSLNARLTPSLILLGKLFAPLKYLYTCEQHTSQRYVPVCMQNVLLQMY